VNKCEQCPSYTPKVKVIPDQYTEHPVLILRSTVDDEYPVHIMSKVGLTIDQVNLASVTRCPGIHSKEAQVYCQNVHFKPPSHIQLIVALGEGAAKIMGCEGKLSDWRGHVLESSSGATEGS
jgi:hypothetical protein